MAPEGVSIRAAVAALLILVASALTDGVAAQLATPGQKTGGTDPTANVAPGAVLRTAPPISQNPPRFVSLKSDRVNVRRGPGTDHVIDWVFRQAGLPVEVIAEADIWRRVRDSEGATGWVLASLLSSRRTALVEPWEVKGETNVRPQVALRLDDRESATLVAQVEAGVIANVQRCDGRWCLVSVGSFNGYIQQHRLWGVYKGESFK